MTFLFYIITQNVVRYLIAHVYLRHLLRLLRLRVDLFFGMLDIRLCFLDLYGPASPALASLRSILLRRTCSANHLWYDRSSRSLFPY